MRYSKIEVIGFPDEPLFYSTEHIHQSGNVEKYGKPENKTEDGLMLFIVGVTYKFILIPETHPIFNIVLTKSMIYNNSVLNYRSMLSKMIVNNYIKKIYTPEVVNSHRRKIQTMKVN